MPFTRLSVLCQHKKHKKHSWVTILWWSKEETLFLREACYVCPECPLCPQHVDMLSSFFKKLTKIRRSNFKAICLDRDWNVPLKHAVTCMTAREDQRPEEVREIPPAGCNQGLITCLNPPSKDCPAGAPHGTISEASKANLPSTIG